MQSQQNKISDHIINTKAGIRNIDAKQSFNKLNLKEQNYAYYFSQAAWQGNKICYFQRSYESPALFYLFQKIFIRQSTEQVEQMLKNNDYSDLEIKQIMVYVAAVFQNCGNYVSFGDKKFIPEISEEKFVKFIQLSESYKEEKERFDFILKYIMKETFTYQNPFGSIGLINKNGLSSYYSPSMTETEAELVNEFMKTVDLSPLNTRVIQCDENKYTILVASIDKKQEQFQYKDKEIVVQYGDFADYLKKVNENLEQCQQYSANDIQKQMIQKYIEHFKNGSIDLHKESQKLWIKDKSPIIETNLGFIEHYLDPLKVRAEWEGFVAIVDKDKSTVLQQLVLNAEQYVTRLPWGNQYENKHFNQPDFTALDVVSFASSGTPIGINIPNYDEIREHLGFKNVDLQNAYGKVTRDKAQFLEEHLVESYLEWQGQSLFVIVALHELLGHGTGKLWQQQNDGTYNFPEDQKHQGYYKANETYSGMFGEVSSGYEECKADSVALYLSVYPDIMTTLLPSLDTHQKEQVLHNVWVEMVMTGVAGLKTYDQHKKQWLQAHCQAGYAILRVLMLFDPTLVQINFTTKDGKDWMTIHIDSTKIQTKGFDAISQFLKQLQIYKSTANVEKGTQFFNSYCEVDDFMIKVKKIVDDNKVPRSIELQPSISKNQQEIIYTSYEESFQGIIQSHIQHYQQNVDDVFKEWNEKKDYFRYK